MRNFAIYSQLTDITPEFAKSILEGNTKNRPLNKTTVQDYAAQMEKDLWKINGEPIIISRDGELLDGQHRLEAVVLSDKTIKALVVYNVDADTFSTIDTGRARTAGDMLSMEGVTNSAQKAAGIMAYFKLCRPRTSTTSTQETSHDIFNPRSTRNAKISKQELLKFYADNKETVDAVVSMAIKCVSKMRLLTNSVISGYAMYMVLNKKYPLSKVEDFFYQLHQVNTETNSTLTTLRSALIRHITKQNQISSTLRHIFIIKTWNAFVSGKTISVLRFDKNKESIPEII